MHATVLDRRLAAAFAPNQHERKGVLAQRDAGMAGAATCASGQDLLQQRQHENLAGRVLLTADSGLSPPNLTKQAANRGLAHSKAGCCRIRHYGEVVRLSG